MSKENGHKLKSYKTKTIICVAIIVILVIAVTCLTIYGIFFIKNDQENMSVTYGITFFSFAISVFALFIALKTFSSIDSVNAITSMDGNVLENEHYAVSYYEMARSFSGDEVDIGEDEENEENTEKDIEENKKDKYEKEKYIVEVFDNMGYAKKKTKTCVEYADWLQMIIDNVIWLRYMDYKSEKYKEKRKSLIRGIVRELDKYSVLSNGIQYTLQEHVKLIKNVFAYTEWSGQKKKQEKPNFHICKLEEVRGSMIRNPVSKLVYYDYLGCYYHKMAKEIIIKIIGDDDIIGEKDKVVKEKESLVEQRISSQRERKALYYLTILEKFSSKAGGEQKAENREGENPISERKKISIFLDRALTSLERAGELAEGDLLWQAYTGYDYVRVKMLSSVINGSLEADKTEIGKRLNQVLSDRCAVQCLYSKEGTYLYKKFGCEIERAEELKEAFAKFVGTYRTNDVTIEIGGLK